MPDLLTDFLLEARFPKRGPSYRRQMVNELYPKPEMIIAKRIRSLLIKEVWLDCQ